MRRYVRQISGRIKTNKIGLIFGIISCVGCSLVVSFSVRSFWLKFKIYKLICFQVEEIPFIHYLGSALTFAGMTVYIWTICSLNYNVTQRSTSCIVIFRITIALLQTFSLILCILFLIQYFCKWQRKSFFVVTANIFSHFYINAKEGCLKRAHLTNTHSQGFYKYVSSWGRTGTS